ncbi:MAG: FAD-dependent oxidoreductase [Rhodobacteraceae bacterium]|nr:FAD-dependent oxidoreductase [Paracoccaceae bacterium]
MTDDVYNLDRILGTEAPQEYKDEVNTPHYVPAPCQVACPVGTDVPSYLGYIWSEEWEDAFEAITATNPFSSICARVCDAPCEPACRREQADGALAIRNLKRIVMDKLAPDFKPTPVPVIRKETVAVVGAGPAGLSAAHDLAVNGFEVHIYEQSDRPGGMMVWGIPSFRLPPERVQEDMNRLFQKCLGIKLHLNCGLGDSVTLDELKEKHDAVLLTIGAFHGKQMGVAGEDGNDKVVDGVGFLYQINGGERPTLPETVVVIGGGDVAMDACRSALRMPGCKNVKVVYRRGPEEIPARKDELEGAIKEDIEFVYNTGQESIETTGNGLILHCVKTEAGEPDEDGRRRPIVIPDSEHGIECGMVIAAIGQKTVSEELDARGLMGWECVATDWESMRTEDPKVFAAGDGAFGGSTIVIAQSHGQRAAYYIRQMLDGVEDPIPYHTPHRTRRVKICSDILWERYPRHEQEFHGLGDNPVTFPEIESTYDVETARAEAARCYRCDAETGSSPYSVKNREDIFSMARTNPLDDRKKRAMLDKRMVTRDNPFPEGRPATLDDLVFLPANLSRLVIDPYREACRSDTDFGGKLDIPVPFFVSGFDEAPSQIFNGVSAGIAAANSIYVGARAPGQEVGWLQTLADAGIAASADACGVVYDASIDSGEWQRAKEDQVMGIRISDAGQIETSVSAALDAECDLLLLDGSGTGGDWPELNGAPDLSTLHDTIMYLRKIKREEHVGILWFGGARSGTDAAKLIAMGANAIVYGVPAALAVGGQIEGGTSIRFAADRSPDEISAAIQNLLKAHVGESTMMARCTGKTNLHNLEPEDLRSITLATSKATGIPLAGTSA